MLVETQRLSISDVGIVAWALGFVTDSEDVVLGALIALLKRKNRNFPMAETIAVYFGCWNEAGHFLWGPGRRSIRDYDAEKLRIPTGYQLDGTQLFLPRPEKIGTGCVTYLPAMDCTVLAWWGSPWDSRGAVNAAFITNGDLGEIAMWQRFVRYFPELSAQLKQPVVE